MSFEPLGLSASLVEALTQNNLTTPTPIQEKAIPAILNKQDVLGIAKTGSGKTGAFILPILTNISQAHIDKNRHIHTLVLVPTRELAIQIKDFVYDINEHLPNKIKTQAVFGGVSINPQMKALSGTQLLIATPGRLIDLLEKNALNLSLVNTLVLDEADKMLTKDFEVELLIIKKLLPEKRQNLLFSATLSDRVDKLQKGLLENPTVLKIKEEAQDVSHIKQTAYFVQDEKRGPLLRHLISTNNWKQVLIFVSSAKRADNVTNKLIKNGIDALALHSKKSQHKRTEALNRFKKGKTPVLVATDVLARGIDIDSLPYVINYELPRSPKDYIHRIGRTGRAGKSGEAISLIVPNEEHHFDIIQKKTSITVDWINGDTVVI